MNSEVLAVIGGVPGVVLLYYGAEGLVRGGVAIARRFGVSPLLIGLTLVALGTSTPELVVSIDAALCGSGDISVGNVVGSNICNIALILGLCAVVAPLTVHPVLLKREMPLLVVISLVFGVVVYLSGGVGRIAGTAFLLVLFLYLYYSFRHSSGISEEAREQLAGRLLKLPVALLLTAAGIIGLIIGARLFVSGAVAAARMIGVSEAVIGLTVVALGTSLPELATSLVASLRRQNDIAVGNVVGSNLLNILVIMGISPLLRPILAPGIELVDLVMMIFLTLILWPFMATGRRISRCEGGFLLLVYAGYCAWLFVSGPGA